MKPFRRQNSGIPDIIRRFKFSNVSLRLGSLRSIPWVSLAARSFLFAVLLTLISPAQAWSAVTKSDFVAIRNPVLLSLTQTPFARLAQQTTPTLPGYPPAQPTPTSQPGYPAPETPTPAIPGYPAPEESPSPSPEFSPTPFPEGYQTPTGTLIPLGTITMVFPSPTVTNTPTGTPTSDLPTGAISREQRDLARFGLFTMVGVLWILLGGWLYILLRRFGF
jgi:hypothetical protein